MTMMFNGFPVVGPDAAHSHIGGTGYEGRDYSRFPIGGLKCSRAPYRPNVDPARYEELIAQKTLGKTWASDLCDKAGVVVKNQQNSSYCWIHAPSHGMEVCNALAGGPKLVFAAFYAGAIIKGGRNQGGSGIEGVQWIAENGICTEEFHKPMDFSTRNSPEADANAKLHKILEYEEFDSNDHASIISSVLANQPVTVGMPAWGHEVLITFLVFDKSLYGWNNGVGYGIDNSWGTDWGNNGRGILSRAYSRFDEAGGIRVVTPADK